MKRTLPILIANESERHFKDGFRTGGGKTDASKGGWRPRRTSAPRNSGRAILVDTGALRRDVKKREVRFPYIRIAAGLDPRVSRYGSVHNRGLGRMPKREFIGKSKELRRKHQSLINKKMKNAFR